MYRLFFHARNKKSGEKFSFTLNDLYGERDGVFIATSGMALNYNSLGRMPGMNPDLEIDDVLVMNISKSEVAAWEARPMPLDAQHARELYYKFHGCHPSEQEERFFQEEGYYPTEEDIARLVDEARAEIRREKEKKQEG